jgi:hypothetical protein
MKPDNKKPWQVARVFDPSLQMHPEYVWGHTSTIQAIVAEVAAGSCSVVSEHATRKACGEGAQAAQAWWNAQALGPGFQTSAATTKQPSTAFTNFLQPIRHRLSGSPV